MPPPERWGGGFPDGPLPPIPRQFDARGRPLTWPLRYTIAHWTVLLTVPDAGQYELCCRTIDANGRGSLFERRRIAQSDLPAHSDGPRDLL